METSIASVIYDNEIAKWKFRGTLTAVESNLWSAVLCKVKDIENKEIKVNLREIAKLANYDLNNRNYTGLKNDIMRMATKVAGIVVEATPTNKYFFHQFVVFQSFEITTNYELIIKVADEYIPYFNRLKKNFSTYEVGNIVHLKSEYTKELYRILMASGKNKYEDGKLTKYFKIHAKDFRERLNVPKSYKMNKVRERIFNVAKRELTKVNILGVAPFESLEIKETRIGRGPNNIELEFKFMITPSRVKKDIELAKAIEEDQKLQEEPQKDAVLGIESNNKQISYKAEIRTPKIVEDLLQKMLEKHLSKKVYGWYGYKAVQLEAIVANYYPHYVYGDTQDKRKFNEDKYKAMLALIYCSDQRQQAFESQQAFENQQVFEIQQAFENNLANAFDELRLLEVRDPFGVFLKKEYDLLQFAKYIESVDELKQLHSDLKQLVNEDNCFYCESIFAEAFRICNELEDELMFLRFKMICLEFDIKNYKSIEYRELVNT